MRRGTATYYFDGYDAGEAWANTPAQMVDNNEATAANTGSIQTPAGAATQLCDTNTCAGDLNSTYIITKVEIRALGYRVGASYAFRLRPVFEGSTDGDTYALSLSTSKAWTLYADITTDGNAPAKWSWTDIKDLDVDVVGNSGFAARTYYCYKVEIKVSYLIYEKKVKKNRLIKTLQEDNMSPRDYDIPYGVASIAVTATGITIVATTESYFHGFSMIANTVDTRVVIYDNASGSSGNILDAQMVLSGLSVDADKVNPIRAKNGIVITVTGTEAVGAVFYSPKG